MTWVLWGGSPSRLCGLLHRRLHLDAAAEIREGGANDAVGGQERLGPPGEDRGASGHRPVGSLRQPAAETAGQAIAPDVVQHGLPGTGP